MNRIAAFLAPKDRTPRRLPWPFRRSYLYRDGSGQIVDVTVLWTTRKHWEENHGGEPDWQTIDVGPFVIKTRLTLIARPKSPRRPR